MNVKKTIATIGLTGLIAVSMGMTPAMAADNGKSADKGNAVSQAAKVKDKGENNKAVAHANAPGQVKKLVVPAPVPETPPATGGGGLQGMEELPEPEAPAPAPVEEAPVEVVAP